MDMEEEISLAAQDVRQVLAGQIEWLVPEGEKHFDPVTVVTAVAGILIGAFLKGFLDEASNTAEKAGKSAFHGLKDAIAGAFRGDAPAEPDPQTVKKSRDAATTLASSERQTVLLKTESSLRETLVEWMPASRAVAVASRVRTAVEVRVLELSPAPEKTA